MTVFLLMELDLISLEGISVFSSRFWGVHGFSMSLGSPSGFGSVRHLYFCSCIKAARSAYLHCHQPTICPWNLCWCFYYLVPPCTAGQSLLGRGLCGSFLFSLILPSTLWRLLWASLSLLSPRSVLQGCVHLFRFPRPALYVSGLMCTCFGSQAPALYRSEVCVHWKGFYATLLSAPCSHHLHHRASVGLS